MSLSFHFRVGVTTVREITTETCAVLWDVLHLQVMPPPDAEQWMNIATEFTQDSIFHFVWEPSMANTYV